MQSSLKFMALSVLFTFFLFSCSEQHQSNTSSMVSSDASMTTESTTDSSSAEQDRVLIKTANLTMEVDHVEKSIQDFQRLIHKLDGHVFHYTLKNEKRSTHEVKSTLDSVMVLTEIQPFAMLKVRVPVLQGDSFIQSVLNMNGTITDFYFDENDVTETITEKKELMLAGVNSGVSKAKSLDQQYFDKDRKEEYIKRKSDFSKMAYQAKHLWFDVQLAGLTYTSKQMTLASKNVHTPFYVRAAESLQNGWYGFSVFISAILTIWPFILMGCVLFFTLKSAWFKRLLKTS